MSAEKQKTILLVEDEAITAMTEKITMEKYGYSVIIAYSGEEAIKTIETTPGIDLILMDIDLGAGMDGSEAAAIIQLEHDLPVIFLSSHTEPEVVAKTEKITFYGYIVKNSSSTVLDASIKMAFKLFEAKTKEKEKEDALRESEEWNKLILSTVLSGVMVIDADTRKIVDVNETGLKLIGLAKEQILGSVCHRFVCPAEEKNCPVLELGKNVDLSEKILLTGTGERKNIIKTVVPVHSNGRKYLIESFVDITERKQAEKALLQSKERYENFISQISDGVYRFELDEPMPVTLPVEAQIDYLYQHMFIAECNPSLMAMYGTKDPNDIIGKTQKDFHGGSDNPLNRAAMRVFIESGYRTQNVVTEEIDVAGNKKYFNNNSVGIIEDGRLLRMWGTQTDISERMHTEEKLRQSEERLRDFIFSMADWVWEVDANGVYTYSSDKGLEFLGASRGDIVGKTPFDFMPADEAKRVGAIFSEIVAKKLPIRDLENWNIGKNGESICLLTNGVPILDEKGNLKGYRGVGKDITERKRAEEAVNNSLRFQRALLDAVPYPIFYKDVNLVYLGGNKAFEKYIGLPQEQFVGKTANDISPADLAANYEKADRDLLEKRGVQTYEASVVHADGTRHDVIFNKAFFANSEDKATGLIGVILDITERKQVEEALRQSEERFRTLYENSSLGLYRTTPDGRIHLANPALVKMLGYSSYADLIDRDLEKTGFEPSYPRAQFVEKIEKHGEVQGIESVWKRNDGATIIVRESARAIRDAQGKTLYYDGIVEDVTERKRVEKLPETLYKISQAMLMSSDLAELYPHIHDLIAGIVPANNFFIALLADDGKTLGFPYYRDEKDSSENVLIQADDPQSLTVEVLRTNKTLLLNETQLQERYATGRNRVWGTAPRCWLGVPLLVREKVIGVMAIQDYRDGNAYGPRDILLLESTAGQIAVAIDRKRAETALRESEERFHSLFDNMNEGVALHELVFENGKPANYRIININDRFLKILGLSGQQVIGKLSSEAYGTATAPYLAEYAGVAVSKKAVSFETYFASLDKRFAISAVPWRESGFATIFTDISERKRAELLEQAVYEIARAADKAESLDDLYRSVHRIILTLMPATNILIARYDEKQDLVSFPYFVDEKDPMPKSRKSSRGLTDYVLRTGRTLLSDAALEKELEHSGEAKRRGSPSACWLGVPLKFGDKAIGVIALDNYSDPKAYGEREKKILEYVSGQIANAIVRKQAEEEIKQQLTEKEILLREVHHRIKNNIAAIGGLISLRLQSISNPEAIAVLQDAIGRVDSMRILYDKLLLSEDYKDISVKNYVESLIDTVVTLFPDNAKVKIDKFIADFPLDSKKLFPLGIIINELLTNKMKYAFSGRKHGSIRIDLALADNRARLTIQDDGNSLPPGFDAKEAKGFGLMLVKMLSKQLGGSFAIANHAGVRCTVEFDI